VCGRDGLARRLVRHVQGLIRVDNGGARVARGIRARVVVTLRGAGGRRGGRRVFARRALGRLGPLRRLSARRGVPSLQCHACANEVAAASLNWLLPHCTCELALSALAWTHMCRELRSQGRACDGLRRAWRCCRRVSQARHACSQGQVRQCAQAAWCAAGSAGQAHGGPRSGSILAHALVHARQLSLRLRHQLLRGAAACQPAPDVPCLTSLC